MLGGHRHPAHRETGKGSGWEQLRLLKTRELGWGLQRAGAVLCSPTPPARQHPSRLPLCLRKQMNFPYGALKALAFWILWKPGAFEPF